LYSYIFPSTGWQLTKEHFAKPICRSRFCPKEVYILGYNVATDNCIWYDVATNICIWYDVATNICIWYDVATNICIWYDVADK